MSYDDNLPNIGLTFVPSTVTTKGTIYATGAKLISAATPQKPSATATAAAHVVATTPVKTRDTNIIDSSVFCGGWVISSRRRMLPYYCPCKVSVAAPEGGTTEMYLAQGTNDSASFKPIFLPAWIMVNVIVPVRGDVNNIPAKFFHGTGAVHTTAYLATRCLDAVSTNPFRDTQDTHRILVMPASMPMLPCANGGYRGKIDETAHDVMDLNIPGTSAWLPFAQDFDADFHLAIASAVADKKVNLGKAWPKTLKKANLVWADSLFIDPEAVGKDEADELAAELAALEAHVKTTTPRVLRSQE